MRDREGKISVRGKPLEVRKQVNRVLKTVMAALRISYHQWRAWIQSMQDYRGLESACFFL